MCGRYTLRTSVETLAKRFELDEYPSSISASYNIAPTQGVAAVIAEDGKRKLEMLHWGLIPSWADDPSVGNRMINARGESVSTKPSFRKAFKNHRCLVLADGFYEWQKTGNGKQPYYIRMEDDSPFAFARVSVTCVGTMSSPHTSRLSSGSITSEHYRDVRARAWAFVFDCYRKKEATRPGGPNDAKESEVGCAATQQYTR